MFALSAASRRVAADLLAPRVAAAALKAVAVSAAAAAAAAAPFSTLMAMPSLRSAPTSVSMPSAMMSVMLSRGLATKADDKADDEADDKADDKANDNGDSPATTAAKRAAGAKGGSKKGGAKGGAKKKSGTAAARGRSSTGRGARATQKKAPSAAATRAKQAAGARRRLTKQKEAEARSAKRESDAARRQKRAETERKRRENRRKLQADRRDKRNKRKADQVAKRKTLLARNKTRKEAKYKQTMEKNARARARNQKKRQTTRLLEDAKARVLRAKKFREAHPNIANRRLQEATMGKPAPVRPTPILARYLKENYARVKDELSADAKSGAKVDSTAVLKEVTKQYKSISAEARAKAEAAYQTDLAKYLKERAAYDAAGPPKRPVSSYILYFTQHQGDVARANSGASVLEITKKVAEQWRALPAAEKEKLNATAEKEMAAYVESHAAWMKAHPHAQSAPKTVKAVTAQLKEKRTATPKTKKERKPRAAAAQKEGGAVKKGRKPKAKAAAADDKQ